MVSKIITCRGQCSMAFRTNKNQQASLYDPLFGLTEREKKFLRESWAESFANHIFPNIDEELFSVIYSNNKASKPITPVNIVIGLLMLKETFGLTDEELMQQMLFNAQYQYALHTSSFKEQPINENTLRRFRNRVSAYEQETGIDLIKKAFDNLTEKISSIMDINRNLFRIDSAMISSGVRRLSRLDIMSETLRVAAHELHKNEKSTELSEKYENSTESKEVGYRLKKNDIPSKMEELLRDAVFMFETYPDELKKCNAYTALRRLIDDQSKMTEDGRVLKTGKEISPESMQTPHELDATYRKKSGKNHIGFIANIIEACDGDKNLITDYDMQKNTYSDAQFGEDVIDKIPDDGENAPITITVDGAYASTALIDKATTKNVEVVTSSLIGGMNGTFETEFEIDEQEKIINRCPAGHCPLSSKPGMNYYQAHFDSDTCKNCQYCDRCPGYFQEKSALIKFSETALKKAQYALNLGTEKFNELARKRNGIEGVPSVLRRRFGIDKMRDKGLVRKRQRLGFKIMSINASRLFGWEQLAQ